MWDFVGTSKSIWTFLWSCICWNPMIEYVICYVTVTFCFFFAYLTPIMYSSIWSWLNLANSSFTVVFFLAILNGLMPYFDYLVNVVHHFSIINLFRHDYLWKNWFPQECLKIFFCQLVTISIIASARFPMILTSKSFQHICNGTTRVIIKIITQALSFIKLINPITSSIIML